MAEKANLKKTKQETTRTPLGILKDGDNTAILIKKSSLLLSESLCFLWGNDGLSFDKGTTEVNFYIKGRTKENIKKCSNFQFTSSVDGWVVFYTRHTAKGPVLVSAISSDLKKWTVKSELTHAKSYAGGFYGKEKKQEQVLYTGDLFARAYLSKNGLHWEKEKQLLFTSRLGHFDSKHLHLFGLIPTNEGNLLVYDASYSQGESKIIQAGAVLFSHEDPLKVLWRSYTPFWKSIIHTPSSISPLGVVIHNVDKKNENIKDKDGKGMFGARLYWVSSDGQMIVADVSLPFFHQPEKIDKKKLYLKKHPQNPIIEPRAHFDWESDAVFNPAAIYDDGRVHLLYRAIGRNNISMLGYASSADGVFFDDRHFEPAYFPREAFEGVYVDGPSTFTDLYASGGGWGGCEDPKLTKIDDTVYLTYVAFDGWSPPRLAMSSIDRADFLAKKWRWTQPKLISRPGVVDKSGCILPEKIDNKFVVFHRVFPDILIDFVDDLDFPEGQWLKGEYKISPRPEMWDSRKLSIGAPPIKTSEGWLVIYHAVDDRQDSQYKIGAMILDLEDPTKVLYRSNHPILVPDMPYENDGKPGVAYPCGAVIIGDELFVYYGGGDKVVCLATVPLDEFLQNLKKDIDIVLEPKPPLIA